MLAKGKASAHLPASGEQPTIPLPPILTGPGRRYRGAAFPGSTDLSPCDLKKLISSLLWPPSNRMTTPGAREGWGDSNAGPARAHAGVELSALGGSPWVCAHARTHMHNTPSPHFFLHLHACVPHVKAEVRPAGRARPFQELRRWKCKRTKKGFLGQRVGVSVQGL